MREVTVRNIPKSFESDLRQHADDWMDWEDDHEAPLPVKPDRTVRPNRPTQKPRTRLRRQKGGQA